MGYLLDTNVISKLSRKRDDSNERVYDWIDKTPSADMYLSVISIGEIWKGIENLLSSSLGSREDNLLSSAELITWVNSRVIARFEDSIIGIDRPIAERWGRLMVSRSDSLTVDTLLASTALVCSLTMVTLNEKDFRDIPGLEILNPNRQ